MRNLLRAAALAVALAFATPSLAQTTLRGGFPDPYPLTVGTTALRLDTSAGHIYLKCWNNEPAGGKTLYVGSSAALTAANGYPVLPQQWIEFVAIVPPWRAWGITTATTIDVRCWEGF